MKYFSQIFRDTSNLHVGTNSECFHEYRDFIHIQSIFSDKWYNLIIPKLQSSVKFDLSLVDKIIESEAELGRQISFYVNHELVNGYRDLLEKHGYFQGGDDCYMSKVLTDLTQVNLPSGYQLSTQYSLDEVIKIMEQCFPGWPGEDFYSRLYESYKKNGQEDRLFETYVVHFNNKVVAAGSISLDKNLNLGYLHNTGVDEKHRHQGLHSALIKQRCNFSLNSGVNRVVCLTEEGSGSFRNLIKNGFSVADKFFVFLKAEK